jgi:hypothetical protein
MVLSALVWCRSRSRLSLSARVPLSPSSALVCRSRVVRGRLSALAHGCSRVPLVFVADTQRRVPLSWLVFALGSCRSRGCSLVALSARGCSLARAAHGRLVVPLSALVVGSRAALVLVALPAARGARVALAKTRMSADLFGRRSWLVWFSRIQPHPIDLFVNDRTLQHSKS